MNRLVTVPIIATLAGATMGFAVAYDAGAVLGATIGLIIGVAWNYLELVRR